MIRRLRERGLWNRNVSTSFEESPLTAILALTLSDSFNRPKYPRPEPNAQKINHGQQVCSPILLEYLRAQQMGRVANFKKNWSKIKTERSPDAEHVFYTTTPLPAPCTHTKQVEVDLKMGVIPR